MSDAENIDDEGEGDAQVEIVPKEVTEEILSSGLGQLARSGNGIEHAYVRLELKDKQLTDIALLSRCKYLRFIDLSGNILTDISALNEIPELCDLNASNNKLTAMNLTPRPHMQGADLSKNELTSCEGIEHPLLKKLNLSENKIESVADLTSEKVPQLEELRLLSNGLMSMDTITVHTLTSLYMDANNLENLVGIGALVNLEKLYLKGNQIVSLDGLTADLKALQHLDLAENQVKEMKEIEKLSVLTGLTELIFADNHVSEDPQYRMEVLVSVAGIQKLDDEVFEEDERGEAFTLREKRAADRLEAEAAEAEAAKEAAEASEASAEVDTA